MTGKFRRDQIPLERNRLTGPPFGQLARGTGETLDLRCGLLFRSIGYRGLPLWGVPFDEAKGVFPNTAGRIGGGPGLYAAGWVKRGPFGIIYPNRAHAVPTQESEL